MTAEPFQQAIWDYYREHGRQFSWRQSRDPYQILVSEVMLQQTQTSRVEPYYRNFLEKFPTVETLASADLAVVLIAWKGLGYNRRARFLKQAAINVVRNFNGQVPSTLPELTSLPGVGKNTAGAILAYAFDKSAVFIETNIRKTFIHFFFPDREKVSDAEIAQKVSETLPSKNIRDWYWALVDYGSMLGSKKIIINDRGKSYKKQSKFEGSFRQMRATILWQVAERPRSLAELEKLNTGSPHSISKIVAELGRDGLISKSNDTYQIA